MYVSYFYAPVLFLNFTSADIPGFVYLDCIQLSTDKLLTVLERGLVSIVNDVGVDINKAVMDPYYRHHLSFIAGLGPRKAQAMLKKIAQLVSIYSCAYRTGIDYVHMVPHL